MKNSSVFPYKGWEEKDVFVFQYYIFGKCYKAREMKRI